MRIDSVEKKLSVKFGLSLKRRICDKHCPLEHHKCLDEEFLGERSSFSSKESTLKIKKDKQSRNLFQRIKYSLKKDSIITRINPARRRKQSNSAEQVCDVINSGFEHRQLADFERLNSIETYKVAYSADTPEICEIIDLDSDDNDDNDDGENEDDLEARSNVNGNHKQSYEKCIAINNRRFKSSKWKMSQIRSTYSKVQSILASNKNNGQGKSDNLQSNSSTSFGEKIISSGMVRRKADLFQQKLNNSDSDNNKKEMHFKSSEKSSYKKINNNQHNNESILKKPSRIMPPTSMSKTSSILNEIRSRIPSLTASKSTSNVNCAISNSFDNNKQSQRTKTDGYHRWRKNDKTIDPIKFGNLKKPKSTPTLVPNGSSSSSCASSSTSLNQKCDVAVSKSTLQFKTVQSSVKSNDQRIDSDRSNRAILDPSVSIHPQQSPTVVNSFSQSRSTVAQKKTNDLPSRNYCSSSDVWSKNEKILSPDVNRIGLPSRPLIDMKHRQQQRINFLFGDIAQTDYRSQSNTSTALPLKIRGNNESISNKKSDDSINAFKKNDSCELNFRCSKQIEIFELKLIERFLFFSLSFNKS